jgi:hypothetical protein
LLLRASAHQQPWELPSAARESMEGASKLRHSYSGHELFDSTPYADLIAGALV